MTLNVLGTGGQEPEHARSAAHGGNGQKADEGRGKPGEQLTWNVSPRQRSGGETLPPVPDRKIKSDVGKMRERDGEAGRRILHLKEGPQGNRNRPGGEDRDGGPCGGSAQHRSILARKKGLECAKPHG